MGAVLADDAGIGRMIELPPERDAIAEAASGLAALALALALVLVLGCELEPPTPLELGLACC